MPPEWKCLPSFVSKRLGLLLSSLSLCLRFGSLTQFPSTTDFCCSAIACQGGISFLSAIFAPSVDVDYTAPKQESRAAADDRSRGKSYSSSNAATPRYGQCNRQAPYLFECQSRNGGVEGQSPSRSLGGPRGIFSHVREYSPYPRPHTVWGTLTARCAVKQQLHRRCETPCH